MKVLKEKVQNSFYYFRTMTLFIILWYLLSRWIENRLFLPSPPEVAEALWDLLYRQHFLLDIFISLKRLILGYLLAAAVGIPLGFLLGLSRPVESIVSPVVEVLRPISPIAWIPIAMFLFGVGDGLAIYIIFYGASFQFLLNTIAGSSRSIGGFSKSPSPSAPAAGSSSADVILPGTLPLIIVAGRLAMASAWMSIIAAELTAGSRLWAGQLEAGIGELMYRFFAYEPNLNYVVSCMIVIGFIALAIDSGFRVLHRSLIRWRP